MSCRPPRPASAARFNVALPGGRLAIERGNLPSAAQMVTEAVELVHRGIECGALVDPWNILGFQGQFSLFPAPENSVPDHRVDQLIELLEQIVSLEAQLWREAAAHNQTDLAASVARQMAELARWWDQFAATTVEGVEAFSGARRSNRPAAWPRLWRPGTRPARRRPTWPFGKSVWSTSIRPRPMRWWSMPCWRSKISLPPWRC